jgi:hypothetical protein
MSFCKVEDSNKNLYILTDKFKQPLITHPHENKNTCFIPNGKKFLDNPELINRKTFKDLYENSFFNDTKIPFILKNDEAIVNKSDIDFNIYDIATINKDIVIKNKEDNDKELTRIEIENNYFMLHSIDKNNNDYYEKMKQKEIELKSIGVVEPPLNILSEYITELYNYYQKLFTKQDITKLVPTDCVVGNWSDCLNNQKTRTIIPATNGGKACTPDENNLPLTQTCQPPSPSPSPSPPLPPSPTIKSSDNNNMYIGIGIFVFFIFAIAFWFYISQPQPQLKPKPK